jgi:serine/threonine protein kinase/Flp pilus assembly protein TadD
MVLADLASLAPDDPSGVGPLVDEMAAAWKRGERPRAEDFLDRHPELWDRPDEAMRLVYEEICLRQEHGEPDAAGGVIARFPRWQARLERLLDCHHMLNSGPPRSSDVNAGDHVGEFRLLGELGRGAAGGVFLASQPALSDRPVVLKITPLAGYEHLSLARLQNTHIVPLYTAFDDPQRDLRVLCMPYFGGASLARLGELLAEIPHARRTGRDLLAALDHVQANSPVRLPTAGPVRQFVERTSFARAVCWFGVCLADALQYAHDRGLVHFDLKPANVLVAADGTPMLLDFHLARSPLPAGASPQERLGGTPLFMAPEQARAVEAFHRNEPAPGPVDGRADVYALGLTLYQLLGGPFPPDPRRSQLPRANPQVSVGLADIVSKCLAPNPAGRYQTASAVADDLRRHLNDLPLRGVRNRSLSEWWGKWRRRRPHAVLAVAGVLAFVAAGIAAGGQVRHRYLDAEAALKEAGRLNDAGDCARAAEVVERGLRGVEGFPFVSRTRNDLHRELTRARSAERAQKLAEAGRSLRSVADRIRFTAIADPLPAAHARELEAACWELWAARDRFDLTDEAARNDLLDVAVVGAGLRTRFAPAGQEAAAHRDALRVLDEAEATLGANAALELERAEHRRALNLPGPDHPGAEPARTVWDHVRLGRAHLRAGRPEDAERHFAAALARDPGNFWATFYRGHCAHRLGRLDDALTAFTVCIALSPDSAECHANRGLINLVLKKHEAARRDFEAALARGGDANLIRAHLATLSRSGSADDR